MRTFVAAAEPGDLPSRGPGPPKKSFIFFFLNIYRVLFIVTPSIFFKNKLINLTRIFIIFTKHMIFRI